MSLRTVSCVTFLSICVIASSAPVRADFIIGVGDVNGTGLKQSFNVGTRATLWVTGYDNTPASPTSVSAYSLAFRLGDGVEIPAEFTNFTVDFAGGLIPTSPPQGFGLETDKDVLLADAVPGHNLTVSNDQGNTETQISGNTSAKNRLFSISFDIGASASGKYGFVFEPNATQFAGNVNSVGGTGFPEDLGTATNTAGSFLNEFTVISAVPEPSSLLLVAGIAGAAALRRKRKFST